MKISGYEFLEVLGDMRVKDYNDTYVFVNDDCFSKSDVDTLAKLLEDLLDNVNNIELKENK